MAVILVGKSGHSQKSDHMDRDMEKFSNMPCSKKHEMVLKCGVWMTEMCVPNTAHEFKVQEQTVKPKTRGFSKYQKYLE